MLRRTSDASRQIKAAERATFAEPTGAPAGATDFMVKLAITYVGGGRGNVGTLTGFGLQGMAFITPPTT